MSGVKDFWQEPAYATLMLSMQLSNTESTVAGSEEYEPPSRSDN